MSNSSKQFCRSEVLMSKTFRRISLIFFCFPFSRFLNNYLPADQLRRFIYFPILFSTLLIAVSISGNKVLS
jgi:hypothetical protein